VGALVAWNYERVSRRIEASSIATVRWALVAHLPPRSVVLEIGAGTGATLASGAYDSSPNGPQCVVLVEPDCDLRGRMEKIAQQQSRSACDGRTDGRLRSPAESFIFEQIFRCRCYLLRHIPPSPQA
jgi:hypothetical protein